MFSKLLILVTMLLSSFMPVEAKPKPAKTTQTPRDLSEKIPEGLEVATLAGGCFWGMEEIIRGIKGVVTTQVGWPC